MTSPCSTEFDALVSSCPSLHDAMPHPNREIAQSHDVSLSPHGVRHELKRGYTAQVLEHA